MGLLSAIGRWFGRGPSQSAAFQSAVALLRARYEAAQTHSENSRRWQLVDLLSAKAANSFAVRQKLRSRAGYCIDNNSYARGIVETKVNNLIGTGPTPKVGGVSDADAKQIEQGFLEWWGEVGGLQKLRTTAKAKIGRAGEGFLVLGNYERLRNPVQLYPRDIEADQVTTPNAGMTATTWIDGVTVDRMGNPVSYDMLRQHPGDLFNTNLNPLEYDTIPARFIIHWFRKDRPGQCRGIPELTPALELFEQMRTFRMATLSAAEHAALYSLYLESTAPADTGNIVPSPFSTMDIERGMMVEGPAGFRPFQLKPENPQATYEMFIYCLLAEACRCLNVPLNIALGTSQKFNFSSARLDHLNYRDGLIVERDECETVVMDRLFFAWLAEAYLVSRAGGRGDGLLPSGLDITAVTVEWHWPPWPALDPLKDAQADTERLNQNQVTAEQFFAEQGKDWDEVYAQLAVEKKLRDKLGLTPVAPTAPTKGEPNAQDEEAQAAAA